MKHDYEIVNGKPHLGLYFGSYFYVVGLAFQKEPATNPVYQIALDHLNNSLNQYDKSLSIRYKQIIERPPLYSYTLSGYGTIGIKYMVWGRAFMVMRIIRKRVKRYKKKLVNGRRKWTRCDKRK